MLLCRFHHRLLHEGGYSLERSRGGADVQASRRSQDSAAPPPAHGALPPRSRRVRSNATRASRGGLANGSTSARRRRAAAHGADRRSARHLVAPIAKALLRRGRTAAGRPLPRRRTAVDAPPAAPDRSPLAAAAAPLGCPLAAAAGSLDRTELACRSRLRESRRSPIARLHPARVRFMTPQRDRRALGARRPHAGRLRRRPPHAARRAPRRSTLPHNRSRCRGSAPPMRPPRHERREVGGRAPSVREPARTTSINRREPAQPARPVLRGTRVLFGGVNAAPRSRSPAARRARHLPARHPHPPSARRRRPWRPRDDRTPRPPPVPRERPCPITCTRPSRSPARRRPASTPPSAARSRKAAETLRHIDWFEVTSVRGHVEDGRVAHVQVTLKVGFRGRE